MFVSRPLRLTPAQARSLKVIEGYIVRLGLDPKTYEASEYPTDVPIAEVHALARICSGGVILGVIKYSDEPREPQASQVGKEFTSQMAPTPWNQIEAGILYSMGLPLLILRERGVTGGVFDHSTGVIIHDIPKALTNLSDVEGLNDALLKWSAQVRAYYYRR